MHPQARSATSVAFTSPSQNGDPFSGTASGTVSPSGSTVSCGFWTSVASGTTPTTAPDVVGVVTYPSGTTWVATFDMTGIPATTSGYLQVTNTSAQSPQPMSQLWNLVWNPPPTTPA